MFIATSSLFIFLLFCWGPNISGCPQAGPCRVLDRRGSQPEPRMAQWRPSSWCSAHPPSPVYDSATGLSEGLSFVFISRWACTCDLVVCVWFCCFSSGELGQVTRRTFSCSIATSGPACRGCTSFPVCSNSFEATVTVYDGTEASGQNVTMVGNASGDLEAPH